MDIPIILTKTKISSARFCRRRGTDGKGNGASDQDKNKDNGKDKNNNGKNK